MWLTWCLHWRPESLRSLYFSWSECHHLKALCELCDLSCSQLPGFSFLSFVHLHSMLVWFSYQQQTQGIPVYFSGGFYLSSFSLSSTIPRILQPLHLFWMTTSVSSSQEELCSAWIPFPAEITSRQKARVIVGSSCLIFFSEISVAQCLETCIFCSVF